MHESIIGVVSTAGKLSNGHPRHDSPHGIHVRHAVIAAVAFAVGAVAISCSTGHSSPGAGASSSQVAQKTPDALEAFADQTPEYLRLSKLIGRGPDFSVRVTRKILQSLPSEVRKCSLDIFDAQRRAMREHRKYSDRSFRNCAIDQSRAWLRQQLTEFRSHVDGNRFDQASASLGVALTAVHQFYAYSNYVELLSEAAGKSSWLDVVGRSHGVWSEAPLAVDETRLQSDFSRNARPKRCSGPPSDLDKRAPHTTAGNIYIEQWEFTAHEVAFQLALEDSVAMLRKAYSEKQRFVDHCGSSMVMSYLLAENDR